MKMAELHAEQIAPDQPCIGFDVAKLEETARYLTRYSRAEINSERDRLTAAVQSIAATLNRSASHKVAAE